VLKFTEIMKPRAPTHTLTRTYVRTKTSPAGETRYQASVVVPSSRETLTATRRTLMTAVRAARAKAGIRS